MSLIISEWTGKCYNNVIFMWTINYPRGALLHWCCLTKEPGWGVAGHAAHPTARVHWVSLYSCRLYIFITLEPFVGYMSQTQGDHFCQVVWVSERLVLTLVILWSAPCFTAEGSWVNPDDNKHLAELKSSMWILTIQWKEVVKPSQALDMKI